MIRTVLFLCRGLGGLALLSLALLVTAEVLTRNLLGFSLLIADEYAGYLGVAITFFGIPFALKEEALLRVDAFIHKLQGRSRAALDLLFNVISLGVGIIFTWQFGRMALRTWERGSFASTPAETPLWIPQSVMVLGSAMIVVVALARICGDLRALKREEGQ